MGFYDLSENKRKEMVQEIEKQLLEDIKRDRTDNLLKFFSDEDTYVRKAAYESTGRIFFSNSKLQDEVLKTLGNLFRYEDEKVRQTAVNALGEIGKVDAQKVLGIFEKAMIDEHHSVRNAVIGSLKKMGEKNPKPVLEFSKKFINHPSPEIRRQAVHGIELRGRTHPEDVLPILEKLQDEKVKRVRDVVIHVLGQISYKKGCLEIVIKALKKWRNKEIVQSAIAEILETHKSYGKFSTKSLKEAENYIKQNVIA